MDKEALAKQSPLSLLGLPDTGPDLLDEVMKGKVQPPGSNYANGFGAAKNTAFDEFSKIAPVGLPESARETAASKAEEEPEPKEEEKQEEPDDLKEDAGQAKEPPADELPSYFHSLNEQHEDIRQRQAAIEQALKQQQQQQQREQAWQQYQQGQQQQAQRIQQQQQQPDNSWAEQGFESAEQYQSWRNSIRKEARQEALEIFQQQNAPIIQQMASDRFSSAVARCSKDYEHFDTYFPRESLNNYFSHIAQKFGVQAAAQMDFEQEFIAAYKVRDYDRISKLQTQDNEKNKANGQTQKDAKEERKAGLKLVPKATQAGAPASKKSLDDEIAEMGKVSVRDVGRHLRSRLFAQ